MSVNVYDKTMSGDHIKVQHSMKHEFFRLATFRDYPTDNKPFRSLFASAGMYYNSNDDEVICYSCGIKKSGWTMSDIPMEIHKKMNPTCAFIRDNDAVNIPMTELDGKEEEKYDKFLKILSTLQPPPNCQKSDASTSTGFFSFDNCTTPLVTRPPNFSFYKPQENHGNLIFYPLDQEDYIKRFGADCIPEQIHPYANRSKHPLYGYESVRFDTFQKGWAPKSDNQSASKMAEAGFYYIGQADCCKCFHCGIGLRNWSEEDNPWNEHAKWAPHCQHVIAKKGTEFVIQHAENVSDETENHEGFSFGFNTYSPATIAKPTRKEQIEKIMKSAAVKSIQEMGYGEGLIYRTIKQLVELDENKIYSISAEIILNEIFNLQNESNTDDLEYLTFHRTDNVISESTSNSKYNSSEDEEESTQICNDKEGDNLTTKFKTPKKNVNVKIKQLLEENKLLKEMNTCKICLDKNISILFFPCGHLVSCNECADKIRKCPICRHIIQKCVKTYVS